MAVDFQIQKEEGFENWFSHELIGMKFVIENNAFRGTRMFSFSTEHKQNYCIVGIMTGSAKKRDALKI